MAEEKKINDEILSDEELEKVSGGSWSEFTDDMLEAQNRGIAGFENLKFDPNSDLMKMISNDNLRHQYVDKLANLFASHGIEMTYNGKLRESNIYKFNGKEISRQQAWDIIDGK
jgi:hypothetical protein